jgi:hypothetical protein
VYIFERATLFVSARATLVCARPSTTKKRLSSLLAPLVLHWQKEVQKREELEHKGASAAKTIVFFLHSQSLKNK